MIKKYPDESDIFLSLIVTLRYMDLNTIKDLKIVDAQEIGIAWGLVLRLQHNVKLFCLEEA
jgi:hypothetical protein